MPESTYKLPEVVITPEDQVEADRLADLDDETDPARIGPWELAACRTRQLESLVQDSDSFWKREYSSYRYEMRRDLADEYSRANRAEELAGKTAVERDDWRKLAWRMLLAWEAMGAALGSLNKESYTKAMDEASDVYDDADQAFHGILKLDDRAAILIKALKDVADPANPGNYTCCDCSHEDENCCVDADYYCPQCIAGKALLAIQRSDNADRGSDNPSNPVPLPDVQPELPGEAKG